MPAAAAITTSGQRISTKGRIAQNLSPPRRVSPIWSRAFAVTRCPLRTSLQPRAAAGACYLHSLMHFSGGVQPPKFPLPWGDPGPHLIHGSLAHPSPQAKRQLDRFIRFCRVHCCVQQTDRPRYIGSMRPHLCHRCTRCDLTALACVNNELLQSTDIHRTYPCCTLANMVDSIDRGHVWACPSMTPKTASFSGGGDRAAD